MKDEAEIIWGLYQEHCIYARHQESQRTSVGMLIVAVSGALLGVIAYDQKVQIADLPLAFLIIGFGIFGAAFSIKHYERFSFHNERTKEYMKKLELIFPDLNIMQLNCSADSRTLKRFPIITKLRVHKFWFSLHVFIALSGFVLSVSSIISN